MKPKALIVKLLQDCREIIYPNMFGITPENHATVLEGH